MSKLHWRTAAPDVTLFDHDGPAVFVGHAAVFGSLSNVLTMRDPETGESVRFVELIEPGAFLASLAANDIRALYNHEARLILGRSSNGLLELAEDSTGLAYTVRPAATSYAADLKVNVESRNHVACSFGFDDVEGGDSWEPLPEGSPAPWLHRIRAVDLQEISLGVTWPAYENTSLAMRSARAAHVFDRRAAPRPAAPLRARARRFLDLTAE